MSHSDRSLDLTVGCVTGAKEFPGLKATKTKKNNVHRVLG